MQLSEYLAFAVRRRVQMAELRLRIALDNGRKDDAKAAKDEIENLIREYLS